MTPPKITAEQDGFTLCIIDEAGHAHCFRIDKAIGAELVRRVNAAPTLAEALRVLLALIEDDPLRGDDEPPPVAAARAALAEAGL